MSDPQSVITIRGRCAADWDAFYALCQAQPPHLSPLEVPYRSEDTVKTLLGAIPDNIYTFSLIAEVDGHLVGEITLSANNRQRMRHIGVIEHLVLTVTASAEMAGQALLAAGIDLADNYLHLTRLEAVVSIDYALLIGHYQMAGFAIEGTLRDLIYRGGRYIDAYMLGRITQSIGR